MEICQSFFKKKIIMYVFETNSQQIIFNQEFIKYVFKVKNIILILNNNTI